ncbi:MAG: hypothetical protein K0U93_24405 [Gammaproteobacteria bacterium]|nr:hypothetical protein [Gammaproteobacteria bacterium]
MDGFHVRVLVAAAAMAGLAFLHLGSERDASDEPPHAAPSVRANAVPDSMKYREAPPAYTVDGAELARLGPGVDALLEAGEYRVLNDRLLHSAAQAVDDADPRKLGTALSLLGQLAIAEQDFDSAQLYLFEALDAFEAVGETVGVAQVHLHLGRMHVKLRQRARVAGHAYDRMLLARWQISAGHSRAARENLTLVIEENLSIKRFGAAASAYTSLIDALHDEGDLHAAEDAAEQAATLFAASGQLQNAENLLDDLRASGLSLARLTRIEQAVHRHYEEFQDSVAQVARAQDYERLSNHYRARGEEQSAWRLRLKASDSLQHVPRRAMYRRLPDALALLYVSNLDMERAHDYLDLAAQTFESVGRDDLASRTARLRQEIF